MRSDAETPSLSDTNVLKKRADLREVEQHIEEGRLPALVCLQQLEDLLRLVLLLQLLVEDAKVPDRCNRHFEDPRRHVAHLASQRLSSALLTVGKTSVPPPLARYPFAPGQGELACAEDDLAEDESDVHEALLIQRGPVQVREHALCPEYALYRVLNGTIGGLLIIVQTQRYLRVVS